MKVLEILVLAVWLLSGVISVWRAYWGIIYEWKKSFNEDYRVWSKNNSGMTLDILLLFSPILALGGLLSLLISEILFKGKWYVNFNKND